MSLTHIINAVFDRLSDDIFVEGYNDYKQCYSVLRDNPSVLWLEEETDYAIDKLTCPELVQPPCLLGFSNLMNQFERNRILSSVGGLPKTERLELEKQTEEIFEAVSKTGNISTTSQQDFQTHWMVNLYLRKYAMRNLHIAAAHNQPNRVWETYAVILEALKAGKEPFRNMGPIFEMNSAPNCRLKMQVSTAEMEDDNGSGPSTALVLTLLDDGLESGDFDTLQRTSPQVEWKTLPLTGLPHRVLTWNFTTSLGYRTRLELPLTLFSGNGILVDSSRYQGAKHEFFVLMSDGKGKMKRSFSAGEIRELPMR